MLYGFLKLILRWFLACLLSGLLGRRLLGGDVSILHVSNNITLIDQTSKRKGKVKRQSNFEVVYSAETGRGGTRFYLLDPAISV